MIFLIVGSQKFPFDRLLQAVDDLVADGIITEEVFAQTGASYYKPQHYKYKKFLDRAEFQKWLDKCTTVITHGGTGAIIGALKRGKKVIAVPRRKQYGEHVDDHQLQLISEFTHHNLISSCDDLTHLYETLMELETIKFETYESNTERYLKKIREFVDEM